MCPMDSDDYSPLVFGSVECQSIEAYIFEQYLNNVLILYCVCVCI